MGDHQDITERLRAVGRQPVDPAVQSAHLTRLAQTSRPRSLRPKLRTAAVFLAGLLVGSSGLAAAGALPDPVQHAAHRVLDKVGVDVPDPERYHGPECGELQRNHGAYVKEDRDLAKSDCGKPITGNDDGAKPERDGCQGPPPWAGPDKAEMTPAEKASAQAERAARCGEEPAESPAPAAAPEPPAATTTVAPATTTTTATTATTPTPEADDESSTTTASSIP